MQLELYPGSKILVFTQADKNKELLLQFMNLSGFKQEEVQFVDCSTPERNMHCMKNHFL